LKRNLNIVTGALALSAAVNLTAYADSGDVVHIHRDPAEPSLIGGPDEENYDTLFTVTGENADIAMTAEEVNITLHPDGADVDAVFDFDNAAADAVTATMGFPLDEGVLDVEGEEALWRELTEVQYENDGFASRAVDAESVHANFEVTVDGESVPLNLQDVIMEAEYSSRTITAMATWSVAFDGGGKRRVHCTYRSDYSDHQGTKSILYCLLTGATWRGPIGYGKLVVRPGATFEHWDGALFFLTKGMPPPAVGDDALVWEFRDLEPPSPTRSKLPECDYLSLYEDTLTAVGAGFLVGFTPPEKVHAGGRGSGLPDDVGVAGWTIVDNLGLREAPRPDADRVTAKPVFDRGDGFIIVGRSGDWYRVRHLAPATASAPQSVLEGWARWRYVDPESDEEYIYVDVKAHGLL
jgi:hypothetical protein